MVPRLEHLFRGPQFYDLLKNYKGHVSSNLRIVRTVLGLYAFSDLHAWNKLKLI
jgi:hypothetical protein